MDEGKRGLTDQVHNVGSAHGDDGGDHDAEVHAGSPQRGGEDLDALDPHDEPADVAGDLAEDREHDESGAEAGVAGEGDHHGEGEGGDDHAGQVHPAAAVPGGGQVAHS